MSININTDAAVVFADKLERMGKSDLPVVINQTLNNAAFDVKQNTMLRSSKRAFVNRQKNFFKATSTVNKSSGFNINQMKAEVGFADGNSKDAVADLQKQEDGGTLKRSFIANDSARVGKKSSGKIKGENTMESIKSQSFVDAKKSKLGGNNKKKFIRAAFYAKQRGKNYVLGAYKTKTGRRTLYRIDKMQTSIRSRKLTIKSTGLYSVKSGDSVSIDSTKFMKRATRTSSNKMKGFYIKNAKKRLGL